MSAHRIFAESRAPGYTPRLQPLTSATSSAIPTTAGYSRRNGALRAGITSSDLGLVYALGVVTGLGAALLSGGDGGAGTGVGS